MGMIDADKFLKYLIFSKHIDGLTCGEVKEAVEMCKVDILDKIREIVDEWQSDSWTDNLSYECMIKIAEILDKYKAESEDKEYILNKI